MSEQPDPGGTLLPDQSPAKQPNVEAILAPSQLPPDQPDEHTKLERQEFGKKAMTAGVRADHLQHLNITILQQQIDHHKEEERDRKQERDDLRHALETDRKQLAELRVGYARLEAVAAFGGWLSIVGNAVAFIGTVLLGIAGAAPLGNTAKIVLVCLGIPLAVAGYLMVVMSALISRKLHSAPSDQREANQPIPRSPAS